MMKSLIVLVALAALNSPARAQTPPSNADILARIAVLEREIDTLKAQLHTTEPSSARPPTLAEASAEAAKIKHEWPRSTSSYTNADLKDGPAVQAPAYRPAELGPEQIRQSDYQRAALKDEMYWKTRMQDVRAKLDADKTFLAEAISREHALDRRLHMSVDSADYIRDRVARTEVDSQWQAALAEVGRLKALVINDTRAITTAEEEARRANVPTGWLRP